MTLVFRQTKQFSEDIKDVHLIDLSPKRRQIYLNETYARHFLQIKSIKNPTIVEIFAISQCPNKPLEPDCK